MAAVPLGMNAQTLVDSIPYPGNLSFWGLHVTPDTIFLGSRGTGQIHYSDHSGNIFGHQTTGHNNQGLIKRPGSYLIASTYSGTGATLREIGLNGALMNTWTFPNGIISSGTSSSGIPHYYSQGVGGLNEAGDGAIWYTVYHPWEDTYPHTYAYKWVPGASTYLASVPLRGRQPYGITVKGDTLFYVVDNIHGDQERIYAYDLVNAQDLFWFALPDTPIDNDQRPRGLHWDGNFLYLLANRQGGSAFAHQTIFIYHIDFITGGITLRDPKEIQIYPNPSTEIINIEMPTAPTATTQVQIFDPRGALVHTTSVTSTHERLDVSGWKAGVYLVNVLEEGRILSTGRISVVR
jgi:hypothetical protein